MLAAELVAGFGEAGLMTLFFAFFTMVVSLDVFFGCSNRGPGCECFGGKGLVPGERLPFFVGEQKGWLDYFFAIFPSVVINFSSSTFFFGLW